MAQRLLAYAGNARDGDYTIYTIGNVEWGQMDVMKRWRLIALSPPINRHHISGLLLI
jgi:hypothetical protein